MLGLTAIHTNYQHKSLNVIKLKKKLKIEPKTTNVQNADCGKKHTYVF